MLVILKPETRTEWLEMRYKGIGGSDAGTVVGVNKYKNNVELWQEKTGKIVPEDISSKPAVIFGKKSEEHLRELFKLDYPKYNVDYHEFYMYFNDDHPFIFATLDGEITDENGKHGVLEIKTTTIQSSSQWDEWDNKIPDSYYAQILHQLAATGWDFAILKAYIRYYRDNSLRVAIRHFRIEREEVQQDMEYLIEKEAAFWKCVKNNIKPALILPEV